MTQFKYKFIFPAVKYHFKTVTHQADAKELAETELIDSLMFTNVQMLPLIGLFAS